MTDTKDPKIILILMAVGILIRLITAAIKESNWLKEAQERQEIRFENASPPIGRTTENPKWHPNGRYFDEKKGKLVEPDYQAEHGEKSPTGWTYDRDTLKWNPPRSLQKGSDKKWRWDAEKEIWIDIEKEQRLAKHNQWRKEQGKGPSYEEWKKAKLEAERKKNKE